MLIHATPDFKHYIHMEWNKYAALKAKELAENKIMERDVNGALRFALKAHSMYPTLDGLPPLLATLNTYISAENRINGEVDRYRVLNVHPSADYETIRKSFRRLAMILHPDKNKAVGSEGAFQIVSEAWSVLSDNIKRANYDLALNCYSMRGINTNGYFPMPQNQNHIFSSGPSRQIFCQRDYSAATPLRNAAAAPPAPYKPTFWTTCHACKGQFEFMTQYLKCYLRCPHCSVSFMAVETLPPTICNRDLFTSHASSLLLQNSSNIGQNKHGLTKEQLSGKAESPGFWHSHVARKSQLQSATTSTSPALSAAGIRSTFASEQIQRNQISVPASSDAPGKPSNARFASTMEPGALRKKRRALETRMNSRMREGAAGHMLRGNREGGSPMETGKMKIGGAYRSNGTRELSEFEKSLLMQKARSEIQKKLGEWSMMKQAEDKPSSSKKKVKEQNKEMENAAANGEHVDISNLRESNGLKDKDQTEKLHCDAPADDMEADCMVNSMSVLDPDFYDFDKNRVESSFGNNQIWAVYDDDDGMPRYYALIRNLISTKPFNIQISWLSSKSNLEFSPVKWVGSGFTNTCGDLRIGKSEVYGSLNSFSHRMKWTKGPRGIIQIYPMKGDVWALYRNWTSDWNEFTPNEIIHSYDMVEVLEDYDENCGVTVAPLVKVPGFRTVFQKHLDSSKIWTIPREEMFRFSHQVPSLKLSGQEAPNAPKGFWELDPASTPLELLQIVSEHSEEENVLIGSKMSTGELGVNGDIAAEKNLKEDVKENYLEVVKAGGKVQEKALLVYQRRRRGRKRNACA